jgi:eukaryotic-like serine/threonine-protein kinase
MKRKPLNIFVKHILIALSSFLALIIIALISLSIYTQHGKKEVVPNVKNMSLIEAETALKKSNLSYEIIDSIFNRAMPPGYVADQDPMPSAIVKKNRKIYLTINAKAVQLLPVPYVINMSLRQAKSSIEAADFTVRKIEYNNSEFKDLVLDIKLNNQSIRTGEQIPAGSALTLVVGNGFNGEIAKVPNLLYQSYDKASELANSNGFNISDPIFDEEPSSPAEERKYIIYKQEPRSNASLATGSFIKIWLSKNPQVYSVDEEELSLEEEIVF